MSVGAVPVTLQVKEGSEYTLEYEITEQGFGEAEVTLSGTITADLTLDPQGELAQWVFTGGQVAFSDSEPAFTFLTTPIRYTAILESHDMEMTCETKSDTPSLLGDLGTLNPSAHTFRYNRGSVTTIGERSFSGETSEIYRDTRNLASDPEVVPFTPETQIILTPREANEASLWEPVRVDLIHTPTEPRTTPLKIPDFDLDLTVFENGQLLASGLAQVPGMKFQQWASTSGLALTSPAQTHPRGQTPLALLYAAGGSPESELAMSYQPATQSFQIDLGQTPTRHPIAIEFTTDPAKKEWERRTFIPVETEGLFTVPATGKKGFLRLAVE